MKKNFTLGIGILTMNQPKNLNNILKSYIKYNFFKYIDQVIVLLQCNNKNEKSIVKKYNIPFISTEKNIGIGPANNLLVEKLNTDYIIILQNDFELVSNDFYKEIFIPIQMIKNGEIDCYRLRNTLKPGFPACGSKNLDIKSTHLCCLFYYNYYLSKNIQNNSKIKHFKSLLKRSKIDTSKYILSSKNACYTENPCIFKKTFYTKIHSLNNVIKCEAENNVQKWWEKQSFNIGFGNGLFTHNDLKYNYL